VRRPECSNDLESYAGGNIITSRASHAGQEPDKETHPGPPGWELRPWANNPTHKNYTLLKNLGNASGTPTEKLRLSKGYRIINSEILNVQGLRGKFEEVKKRQVGVVA
jgi:hypothetical protein